MRLFSLICALLIASPSWASIGSVTELTGTATIKRGKESIAIAKGTTVEQNDKVETKNGKLKITFKDNTVVSVTEHSALVIDDFVYDPKNAAGSKLGLKAAGGTVRYVSGAIAGANPNAVKINTPTAAIAVRGTDFVMSVNEIGSSMVILMPSCEDGTGTVGTRGVLCGSGKIEVESGPNRISMDRPYQATLVESVGQPPTPPVTVNLFNTPIGNNLQISPPKTMGGASVVAAARAAAIATGVTREAKKEDKDDKDSGGEEKQTATDKKQSSSKRIARASGSQAAASQETAESTAAEEQKTTTVAEAPEAPTVKTDLAAAVTENSIVAVAQSTTANTEKEESTTAAATTTTATEAENPYVKKLWKDKSETKQIGWQYESLAPNNRNYVNVSLPIDTKVQVVVTQDMQTNSWNFNSMKAQGQIVINQAFR